MLGPAESVHIGASERLSGADLPESPAGFRPEDVIAEARPEAEGFYPIPEVARHMGRTEKAIVALARSGVLQARKVGSRILVRPALIGLPGEDELGEDPQKATDPFAKALRGEEA